MDAGPFNPNQGYPTPFSMSINPDTNSFYGTLESGNFNPLGSLKSPDQIAAMQNATNFTAGINTGAQVGSGSGGRYLPRSATDGGDAMGGGGGIAPLPTSPAPPPNPLGSAQYNPSVRDNQLRQLGMGNTPAPTPQPSRQSYSSAWDQMQTQAPRGRR